MRLNQRRPGVTLMEVLIATFILSIGVVAIMALFPIGAVNFARAINHDRATTHAVNSDAIMRHYWRNAWETRDPVTNARTGALVTSNELAFRNSREPMLLLLEAHPAYGPLSGDPTNPGNTSDPSYPVLVDPIGWQTKTAVPLEQGYIGGNATLPVRTTLWRAVNDSYNPTDNPWNNPRWKGTRAVPLPAVPGFPHPNWSPAPVGDPDGQPVAGTTNPYPHNPDYRMAIRLTTLLDDLTFDNGGEPAAPTGQLERAGRYTASWLIQRPVNNVPTEVRITVLVFGGRSQTDVSSAETAFANTTANLGSKNLTIPLAGQAPPYLRRGQWIGFSHLIPKQNLGSGFRPTMDFYRIAAINEDIPDTLIVETDRPIKVQGFGFSVTGTAVIFDNLLEVYDRGVLAAGGGMMK